MDSFALVNGQGVIAEIRYDKLAEPIISHTQDFTHSQRSVFSNVLQFPSWESAYEMKKRLLVRGYTYEIVTADNLVLMSRVSTYMMHDVQANLWLQLEEQDRILDLQDEYIQRSPEDAYDYDDYNSYDDWADDYDAFVNSVENDPEVLLAQQDAEEYYETTPNGWATIDTSVPTTVQVDGMVIEVDPVPAA